MPCAKVTMPSCPSHAFVAFVPSIPKLAKRRWGRVVYFNFFLGRSWLVWPHFFLRCDGVSWVRDASILRASPGQAHADTGWGGTYAVDSPRWQTRVALAADHLVAVVLGGERLERRLNDATTETEDQVESRLLLDVVVGKGAAILELLAGEDQALLVRGNALLVLDLGLDVVCALLAPVRPRTMRLYRLGDLRTNGLENVSICPASRTQLTYVRRLHLQKNEPQLVDVSKRIRISRASGTNCTQVSKRIHSVVYGVLLALQSDRLSSLLRIQSAGVHDRVVGCMWRARGAGSRCGREGDYERVS
jgi:hypothetical protein